jgi:phage repressor protein C with HTH and peptisase S24 domain
MFTHQQVWNAIDVIAERSGLSASALAKRAGLDSTSFNKSKRVGPDGRQRWPTTESMAKVLAATDTSVAEFTALLDGGRRGRPERRIPLIGLVQAGSGGFFDDAGFPVGGGWEEIGFPGVRDENAYAVEITGDSMEPVYRDGDIIIVSPNSTPRRGDRVVVRTKSGEVLAKILKRQTAQRSNWPRSTSSTRPSCCPPRTSSGSAASSGRASSGAAGKAQGVIETGLRQSSSG